MGLGDRGRVEKNPPKRLRSHAHAVSPLEEHSLQENMVFPTCVGHPSADQIPCHDQRHVQG